MLSWNLQNEIIYYIYKTQGDNSKYDMKNAKLISKMNANIRLETINVFYAIVMLGD